MQSKAQSPWGRRLLAAGLAAVMAQVASAGPTGSTAGLAVLEFSLRDTSGEARDQQTEHRARLTALSARLRSDLAGSGRFQIVDLVCGSGPCPGGRTQPGEAVGRAREAGADFLLLGAVHKMSTLVLNVEAQVVDVRSGAAVFTRKLSFRGDNDEAWRRAAAFLARDLAAALPARP